MREKLKNLLAHVTLQDNSASEGEAGKPGRGTARGKKLKLDSETDDVRYEKLYDED